MVRNKASIVNRETSEELSMRQGNNGRRPRGGRPNRRPGPAKAQTYDSNGPDVRIRGNAHQVYEKYLALARDATTGGDRVLAESYYQFAEHYLRIVAAAQAYNQQMQQQFRRPDDDQDEEGDEDGAESQGQPRAAEQGQGEQPRESDGERQQQPQQNFRQNRDQRDDRGNRDNRDRNRPRFQDRRDGQPAGNAEARGNVQPRETAPPARVESTEDQSQWEAPSFLRRPAPLPATETAGDAPDDTAAAPAAERKPRRPYTRREKPVDAEEGRAAEATPEPAAD